VPLIALHCKQHYSCDENRALRASVTCVWPAGTWDRDSQQHPLDSSYACAMPLVLEEDVRVANGFDPASASTLYWKQVPVLVKQHDREDQTEQLTFRILSGVTRQNHSLRVRVSGCLE
jgi:hypothetical protein